MSRALFNKGYAAGRARERVPKPSNPYWLKGYRVGLREALQLEELQFKPAPVVEPAVGILDMAERKAMEAFEETKLGRIRREAWGR